MRHQSNRTLGVQAAQALSAFADRRFLVEVLPGHWTVTSEQDDVVRGRRSFPSRNGDEAAFDLTVRLVDIDLDAGALRFEARIDAVADPGRIALVVDANFVASGEAQTDLRVEAKIKTTGFADFVMDQWARESAIGWLEQFGDQAVARIAQGDADTWVVPGSAAATASGHAGADSRLSRGALADRRMVAQVLGGAFAMAFGWAVIRSFRARRNDRS